MKKSRQILSFIASILITAILIFFVVKNLEWESIRETFSQLIWKWLLIALLTYIFTYILRTFRFQALIYKQDLSFLKLMGVTFLHGMLNYVMPARTGEFSYPVLLNQVSKITITKSTATLLVARFFDFAFIVLSLPLVLIALWDRLPGNIAYSLLVFIILVILLGIGLIWALSKYDARGENKADVYTPRCSLRLQIIKRGRELLQGMQKIAQLNQYKTFILLTIGIWVGIYTNFYFIVLSLGYEPSYLQMAAVSALMVPLTLLPINGLANIGAHEAGWTTAFLLFNYSREISLSIAVSSHIILLVFVLIIGATGFLTLTISPLISLFFTKNRKNNEKEDIEF